MQRSFSDFRKILENATDNRVSLYREHSSYPKPNAQDNLVGRTHYADDSTLAYFSARILSARSYCDGALFIIIESTALDYQKTRRGFRFVAFDIFGNTIERAGLDDAFKTRAQAEKARDKWYGGFDIESYYLEKMQERAKRLERETAALWDGVAMLSTVTENAA
jgi:hypothetical protein